MLELFGYCPWLKFAPGFSSCMDVKFLQQIVGGVNFFMVINLNPLYSQ
jgi:hypothetical protein